MDIYVHPVFKQQGIGSKLRDMCIELCKQYHVDAAYCTTSEKANLIKAGWQKTGYNSYKNVNYFSVIFRLSVDGRQYSKSESWLRYYFSMTVCKLLKKECGEYTVLGRIIKRILQKLLKKECGEYTVLGKIIKRILRK
jgi:hypothetical protein